MATNSAASPTPTPVRQVRATQPPGANGAASEVPSVSHKSMDLGTQVDTGPNGATLDLTFLSPAEQPDELGRLAEFRVLKELGHGGMGAVFLADDSKLKRAVALKVMLPQVARVAVNRERFLREAQAAAQLEHDNVVSVYQVREANGVPFIAMPFLKGESLQTRLQREGTLPVSEVIRIGQQIAEGLAAAHEQDLVHRDIKPGNIWLENRAPSSAPPAAPSSATGFTPVVPAPLRYQPSTTPQNTSSAEAREPLGQAQVAGNTRVKILDFGLARLGTSSEAQHLTTSGTILGTPSYMSPEQARNTHTADFRCDLFSLGAVLYRMATGRLPFAGTDLMSLLTALAVDTPAAPSDLNPNIPRELSDLIEQLLAKQPESRPASAREVASRLAALQHRATPQADSRDPHPATPLAGVVPAPLRYPTPTAEQPTVAQKRGNHPDEQGGGRADITTVILSATEQRRRRKTLLIGLALAACVVLAGIIIRIKHKDGSVTEIKVPSDAKVEIVDDQSKMAAPGRPAVPNEGKTAEGGQPTSQATDPNRAAAEWALSIKGTLPVIVTIQLVGESARKSLESGQTLPNEPFRMIDLRIRGLQDATAVSDAEIARYVAPLRSLQLLWILSCPSVTDDSLPRLKQLAALTDLNLSESGLSGRACAELTAALPLTAIGVSTDQFTDDLAALIRATPRITSVELYGGTDSQLRQLLAAKQIKSLVFAGAVGAQRASAETSTWRELPERFLDLDYLHVTFAQISDTHLAEIARFPKLRHLAAVHTPITDDGLKLLHACRTLRDLDVRETKVTAEGIATLHAALPDCRITWDGGVVEPAEVPNSP